MWHLSLIPVGFVDYRVLRVTAASVSLAALIWAWGSWLWCGDLLSRWAWQRNLQLLSVLCLYEPAFFSLGYALIFQCSSSAAGGVGPSQGSAGIPPFVCVWLPAVPKEPLAPARSPLCVCILHPQPWQSLTNLVKWFSESCSFKFFPNKFLKIENTWLIIMSLSILYEVVHSSLCLLNAAHCLKRVLCLFLLINLKYKFTIDSQVLDAAENLC